MYSVRRPLLRSFSRLGVSFLHTHSIVAGYPEFRWTPSVKHGCVKHLKWQTGIPLPYRCSNIWIILFITVAETVPVETYFTVLIDFCSVTLAPVDTAASWSIPSWQYLKQLTWLLQNQEPKYFHLKLLVENCGGLREFEVNYYSL